MYNYYYYYYKKILNESCVAPSMIEKIFHFTTVELKWYRKEASVWRKFFDDERKHVNKNYYDKKQKQKYRS